MLFSNKNEAFEYLREIGYKISQGKFSQDSNALLDESGSIDKKKLLNYAKTLKKVSVQKTSDDFATMRQEGDARKSIAAAEREEIRLESEKRELEKKWMLRDEAEQEICIWTALARDSIAARFEKSALRIIESVKGEPGHLPDLHAVIDEIITDACNDIANMGEVTVEFRD